MTALLSCLLTYGDEHWIWSIWCWFIHQLSVAGISQKCTFAVYRFHHASWCYCNLCIRFQFSMYTHTYILMKYALHRSDSSQGSDYIAIFLSLISLFLRTTFEYLKCAMGGELIFLSNWIFRLWSYNTRHNLFQNITISKFFLHCILLSLMFEILLEYMSTSI